MGRRSAGLGPLAPPGPQVPPKAHDANENDARDRHLELHHGHAPKNTLSKRRCEARSVRAAALRMATGTDAWIVD